MWQASVTRKCALSNSLQPLAHLHTASSNSSLSCWLAATAYNSAVLVLVRVLVYQCLRAGAALCTAVLSKHTASLLLLLTMYLAALLVRCDCTAPCCSYETKADALMMWISVAVPRFDPVTLEPIPGGAPQAYIVVGMLLNGKTKKCITYIAHSCTV